jgi:amino acid permease
MHRNLIFLVALTAGANLALSHVGVSNLPSLSTKTYPDDKVIATAAASSSVSGEATIPTSILNLAKSIIGAGVLSLPSGVAFLSDSPVALVPAGLVCATMGVLAAYSFSLIGKSCDKHKSRSFQDAWAKSVDPKTAWLISAGITAKCLLASLAYSIIIGM